MIVYKHREADSNGLVMPGITGRDNRPGFLKRLISNAYVYTYYVFKRLTSLYINEPTHDVIYRQLPSLYFAGIGDVTPFNF